MSVKTRISQGLKMTLLGRIVRIGTNGLLLVLLTRYLLNPESYGLLVLTLSILGVCQLFSDLGLGKSAAKYVTEYRESDASQIPYIVRQSLKFRTATILLTMIAVFIGSQQIAKLVSEPSILPLLYAGVFYIAFNSYRGFNSVLFQGFNEVSWTAIMQIINNVGRVFFAILFVVVIGLGAFGVLLGYLAGAILSACVGFIVLYTRFYTTFDKPDSPESGLSRRILEYSCPLTITRSAGIINGKVDSILIGYFLAPSAVGLYALGKQITSFTLVPAGSLGFAVSPTYGEQKANKQLDHAGRLYEKTLEYILLLYVPAAIGLIFVAEPTIRIIFGREYLGSVPVIQVFSLYIVLQAIVQITTDGLDYLGKARIRATAKGTMALTNVGLNVLLIPRFGITGAAIATVFTTSLYAFVNIYTMHQEVSLRYIQLTKTFGTILVIAGIMGIAVFLTKQYITGLISLAGVVLLGITVWLGLGITIGPLDPDLVYELFQREQPKTDISD